jgi:hypothetical protein
MLLIVTLPAASGFLASYALLGAESGSSVGGVVRGHVRVGHGAVCAGAQSIADVLLRAKGLR